MNKKTQARHMYMNQACTQREIAQRLKVSERTIYNWIRTHAWDRLKQAAYQAPVMISENITSQIVELQNTIARRQPGERYPTPQEAEVLRKLILCFERMRKYPNAAQSMQTLETFKHYVSNHADRDFKRYFRRYSERFIEAHAENNYYPFQMEFGMDQIAPVSPFYHEQTDEEIQQEIDRDLQLDAEEAASEKEEVTAEAQPETEPTPTPEHIPHHRNKSETEPEDETITEQPHFEKGPDGETLEELEERLMMETIESTWNLQPEISPHKTPEIQTHRELQPDSPIGNESEKVGKNIEDDEEMQRMFASWRVIAKEIDEKQKKKMRAFKRNNGLGRAG